jgi:hypothetical protein
MASMAFFKMEAEANFPVPRKRRDRKVLPEIFNISSTPDKTDQFQNVSLLQDQGIILFLFDDPAVAFCHNGIRIEIQIPDKGPKSDLRGNLFCFTVTRYFHGKPITKI